MKPNYAFAKRQKDLARKQKKEEKRQEKLQRKAAAQPEQSPGEATQQQPAGETPET